MSIVWFYNNKQTNKQTEPPGREPLVVNGVVVGPFEEDDVGSTIASDRRIVKVKGEDLDTPDCLRSVDTGNNPGTVKIPQYQVNKTKQRTHTETFLCKHVRKKLITCDNSTTAHHVYAFLLYLEC